MNKFRFCPWTFWRVTKSQAKVFRLAATRYEFSLYACMAPVASLAGDRIGRLLPKPARGAMQAIIVRTFVGAVTCLNATVHPKPAGHSASSMPTQNCGSGSQY